MCLEKNSIDKIWKKSEFVSEMNLQKVRETLFLSFFQKT